MQVLALDISKTATGVAIGDAVSPPRSFVVSFSGQTRGHVWARYAEWLRGLLVTDKPDLVAYEAPRLKPDRYTSMAGVRLLTGLANLTETLCARRNIPCKECEVKKWRKLFLDHGRPHDPKQAALNMCATLGWQTGGSHDRAEALGIWAWAHFTHGDRRAIMRAMSNSSVRAMGAGA